VLRYAFGSVNLSYSGTVTKKSEGIYCYDLTFGINKTYNFSPTHFAHILAGIISEAFSAGMNLESVGACAPFSVGKGQSFTNTGKTTQPQGHTGVK
jgi:hypothetical protein